MINKPLSELIIAVIMGGTSAEREISLRSGNSVIKALEAINVKVFAFDGITNFLENSCKSYDAVFNILHGEAGENGELAGLLSSLGVLYTGCDIQGAVLSWDKNIAKTIIKSHGIDTPKSQVISNKDELILTDNSPRVIKPTQEGSSVGLYFSKNNQELEHAVSKALILVESILVEEFIEGSECTVSIVNGTVLPVVRIKPNIGMYDYEAKYNSTNTEYFCPSGYDEKLEKSLQKDALLAFKVLKLKGWARIDFMVDNNGKHWFLEANTTPGMTKTSLVPKAAKAIGWDFEKLVLEILSTAFAGDNDD